MGRGAHMAENHARVDAIREVLEAAIGPRWNGRAHDARSRLIVGVEADAEAVRVERLAHLLGAHALAHERVPRAIQQVRNQHGFALVGDESAHTASVCLTWRVGGTALRGALTRAVAPREP